MQTVQPGEIGVPLVHHIERPGLGCELVQRPQVVRLGVGDPQKDWDSHAQVQHRVRLDPGLASPETGPREQLQAEVDRRGVQRVRVGVEVRQLAVHRQFDPRRVDHRHRGVHEDAVVPPLVGLRQRAAGHAAADPAVVTAAPQRRQARDRVAEARAPRELREDHAQELIHARERPHTPVAVVASHGVLESTSGQEFDQLGEDAAALVHTGTVADRKARNRKNGPRKMKSCTPSRATLSPENNTPIHCSLFP